MAPLSAIACIVLFVLLLYKYMIYPTCLSPLSKIPNAHFTASISPLWILWIKYKSIENQTLYEKHKDLGPVIRLGPNELSVNCIDGGIRTIYGGGFEKTDWYPTLFENYGVPNMFSTTKSKPHSAKKRMLSNVYSKSYLQSSKDMQKISQVLVYTRLLPILDDLATRGESTDVYGLNFAMAMDFITAYIFGVSNGSNFLWEMEIREHWLRLYQSRNTVYRFWPQELLKLAPLLRKVGIGMKPEKVDLATDEIEVWELKMCKAVEASKASQDNKATYLSQPVVFDQLAQSLEKSSHESGTAYPRHLVLASELMDHSQAGHETTTITLTFLMHELSRRPELQSALRKELFTLEPGLYYGPSLVVGPADVDLPDLPSPRSIDALALLDAIVMETLRLHSAVPGPQPRMTPHNPSQPTTLGQYTGIPGGVRVSGRAWTLHRNQDVYPDPWAWKPERWLNADKDSKDEMMRWFWAFGSGGRMCIGSHFAMQEMKLVVAAIYANYTTSIVDDSGIEQQDMYLGGPKSNKLSLKFERL